jgi:hypothetical protein
MMQQGMPMMGGGGLGGPGMMGMGMGMGGPGMMHGQGGIAYPPNPAAAAMGGQMMENQMMAQHQAMHGQALPVSMPLFCISPICFVYL